jgi:hypothetical protein
MHKLRVLYFFCLMGIAQSSNCSNAQPKDSLVKTATQIATNLFGNIQAKESIRDLTPEFFCQEIKKQFEVDNGIKNFFKSQDIVTSHPCLFLTGSAFASLSCLYTIFRVIKCARKHIKKRTK